MDVIGRLRLEQASRGQRPVQLPSWRCFTESKLMDAGHDLFRGSLDTGDIVIKGERRPCQRKN
jgi:hypothetical protein